MLLPTIRTFQSELIKFRRWSVLAGGAAMSAFTAFFVFVALARISSGGRLFRGLDPQLPTAQGLTALLGGAGEIVTAIAVIIVAANVGAEWSQGTIRNLLVRQPDRLQLLAGKMLALLLFVLLAATLALFIGAGVSLVAAHAYAISTSAWTSAQGVNNFFSFLGNRLIGIVGFSLLGMLIAVLTRSVAAAVGLSLAYVLVVESLMYAVWPEGAQWGPAHVFGYLTTSASAPMSYGAALGVALLWMLGFAVVSGLAFERMDITA